MCQLPCRKRDVEFIVWNDAVGQSTRGDLEAAAQAQLATNVNVGWVVHENEERIVLCNGTSDTGEMDHLVIPAGNVLQRIAVRKS